MLPPTDPPSVNHGDVATAYTPLMMPGISQGQQRDDGHDGDAKSRAHAHVKQQLMP